MTTHFGEEELAAFVTNALKKRTVCEVSLALVVTLPQPYLIIGDVRLVKACDGYIVMVFYVWSRFGVESLGSWDAL